MDYLHDPATGAFRLTQTGLEKYRVRFARAGIDINQIKSADHFNYAMSKSAIEVELPDCAAAVRQTHPQSIERDCLLAILEGDYEEMDRLLELIKRRNAQFRL